MAAAFPAQAAAEARTDVASLEVASASDETAATGAGDDDWEVTVVPYGWLSGMKLDIDTPQGEQIGVDESFGDILDVLKFTVMGAMEERKGRFVAIQDLIYLSTESKGEGSLGPGLVESEVDQKLLSVTLLAGYRAVDEGPLSLDVLAGARITTMKINIDLTGPLMEIERDTKATKVGPVVASRFHAPLGENWGLGVYGDLGGFGVTADLSWQLMANIHYRISDHWSLGAGWRHFEADQEKDGFDVKLAIDGPFLVASYRF
ncbi:MAG TPA: hypothetical protein VFR36_09610 [Sphingomicrobium sp.]|nr:hypothetical protein [Sphingomicrobium sp.]